ncbi:hypothetical protein GCM10010211_00850 [Streptomyces albospinus]|uniref:DUF402 domain-containing protein n=1 Tax=Streptomyces albospinus TaxID=285515 RepID=A0ABQ2UKG0_9ACTN|nr:hypothetical protein [Streptomyces albospinus]GGU41673.1 hypothetical protein GCM10010211_00850 [Streptomyces albospinus]
MHDTIAITQDGRFRVRLVPDEDARNPREDYDHLAHVITIDTHLGYYAPIDKDGGPLADAWNRMSWNRWNGIETFTRWARIYHGAIVIESRPARGPVSLWYLMGDDAEDLGMLPEAYLDAEREEYEAWAEGDVYGYIVEEAVDWLRADDDTETRSTWEEVDSCWGHFGHDWATEAARQALAFYAAKQAVPA